MQTTSISEDIGISTRAYTKVLDRVFKICIEQVVRVSQCMQNFFRGRILDIYAKRRLIAFCMKYICITLNYNCLINSKVDINFLRKECR